MRLRVLLAFTVLSFILVGNARSQNSQELKDLIADIKIYLLTSHILSPQETKDLKAKLNEFMERGKDISSFKEMAYLLSNKLVRDRANLQFLLFDLEKLEKDDYSQKIAGIEQGYFKGCRQYSQKFISMTRKRRPYFNKPHRALKIGDYKRIIKTNSRFFIDSRLSSYGLWKRLKERLGQPYPLWLDKYHELLKILKTSDKEPEEIFSVSQLKFLKVFGRVYGYYSRLEGNLSSDLESF